MKFSGHIMPLKVTSTSYFFFLIPYLKPFQNSPNFLGRLKTCTSQRGTVIWWKLQFLWKPKNMNVEGGWKLKLTFCFTETTHESLDKRSLYNKRSWTYLSVPFESLFLWIFKILQWSEILTLCLDRRWTTMCRILWFCAVSQLCRIRNFLLNNAES
jgi:hypothetical protein